MVRSGLAFRAQLVIPEQLEIYDYWCRCAGGRTMPTREDINPRDIPRLLPFVSLIEIERRPTRYRIRLAGTRLYDVYNGEITGKYVDELDWGAKRDYWISSYRRVVEAALPAQGIVRAPYEMTEHLTQFWLRLPLADPDGQVRMILSYDAFVPVSEAISLETELAPGRQAEHLVGA
jgi:hypothetical protein